MHSDWNLFKIRSVWFRYIYSMINHSHSFTYKRNIFLTKILANAPIIVFYVHLHAVCLSDILKVMVQFLNHSNTCILKTCSIYVQLHLPMGDTCSVSNFHFWQMVHCLLHIDYHMYCTLDVHDTCICFWLGKNTFKSSEPLWLPIATWTG